MCLVQHLARALRMFGHVEQGLTIISVYFVTITCFIQPSPKGLVRNEALTCIVQDVDELECAINPELAAFSLLLKSVLDLRPSEVEVAFDVGQPAGVCG